MSILCFKEKDGTVNVLLSGKVSREPEIKSSQKGDKVRFSLAYGKSKFMNVEAWADSDMGRVAGVLEKGDSVCVMGEHRAWTHEDKQYQCVTADMILTGAVIPSAPASAPAPSADPTSQTKMTEITEDDAQLPF